MSTLSKKKVTCVGLTGTMGSGKSKVLDIIKKQGFSVIDCDRINHRLLEKGEEGYQKILATFHDSILREDETIDVQKLSAYIFRDKEKKEKLETILHPLIQKYIYTWMKQQENVAFVEVPLLFEVSWQHMFDEIWVVACDEEIALKRLSMYRNIDKEEAKKRIVHQMPQEEKVKQADVVLWNNEDESCLERHVKKELKRVSGR